MAEIGAVENAEQVRVWNGDSGRHWEAYRERYAAMHRPFTDALLTAAAIRPGQAVLDIGCGCGATSLAAARSAAGGPVLGVDVSETMLAQAREDADRAGLGTVRFVAADAQVHSFAVAGFDLAISRFGVMFFADPSAAFANIARALRPGGRLVFVCWQELARNEFRNLPLAVLAEHLPVPQVDWSGPGGFSLADPARIRDLLGGAGFSDVRIEPVVGQMWMGSDIEDVLAYWRDVRTFRSILAAGDECTTGAAITSLRESLRPHQTGDGVRLGAAAWLVTAAKPE
jgi:ubiquinone/menaquinone biosynthesis C-methylase UbiE